MEAVQHALDVRLASPQPDVDASADVTEHHADLVGTPQCDQPDGADEVRGDITLALPRRGLRGGVPAGVGYHEDLVMLL
jgi:hypothetical protein